MLGGSFFTLKTIDYRFLLYAKCKWCIKSPEEEIFFNLLSHTTMPVIKGINDRKLDLSFPGNLVDLFSSMISLLLQ